MQRISVSLRMSFLGLLSMMTTVALAQVNGTALTSELTGKALMATVEIGFDGETASPVIMNGQPVEFPVKTLIYPDGHERIRIERGILHADAAKYRSFKTDIEFHVSKVTLAKDNLEIVLTPPSGSTVGDLKVMFSPGWQTSMTNDAVLETVKKYLVAPEVYAKLPKAPRTPGGPSISGGFSNSGGSSISSGAKSLDASIDRRLPGDRDLRSLQALNQIDWWKLTAFLGKDNKSTYDATKTLSPSITTNYWAYKFPYQGKAPTSSSTTINVSLWLREGHVDQFALQGPVGIGGEKYADNVPGPLDVWGKKPITAADVKSFKAPELYAGEFGKLVTQEETASGAARKLSFYYPYSYDATASYKAPGAVEKNGVPFGNVIFITFDMGNGYVAGAYCIGRPGNYMFTYSSSFDPSTSESPTTVTPTPFDWTRFAVYDLYFFPASLIGSGSTPIAGGMSLGNEAKDAFAHLNNSWVPFTPR